MTTGRLTLLVVLVVLLLLSLGNSLALYVDWLWFGEVGYQSVFTTLLSSQVLVGGAFGAGFFLVFFANVYLAGRHQPTRYWGTVDSLVLLQLAAPLRDRPARVVEDADGWTLRTHNGALAVHHENTVVIRHGRPLVLTAA